MIRVRGLVRRYTKTKGFIKRCKSSKTAVDGIDLEIHPGEIFGILGPNGAGKTTTIKVLTTLLLPDEGSVEIFGLDIDKHAHAIRKRINFIYGGERSLYNRLSAYDNLVYFCDLYSVPENDMGLLIDRLLVEVGMDRHKHERVETFSKGMKQRLQIARALVNDPDIIFMDEPTIGLDPMATNILHGMIRNMKERGKTIILTTHYMKEAEELCDRIALMDNGKILGIDTPQGWISNLPRDCEEDLNAVYIHHFGNRREVSV